MKKTLYPKMMLGYLLYGILGFLSIATFTTYATTTYMTKAEASKLYRECALISTDYARNFYTHSMTLEEIEAQLSTIDVYLDSEIWMLDSWGRLILNSADEKSVESVEMIEHFNIQDFGNQYYQIGSFYNYFDEDTLSVFSPITVNYKVRGYVIIHKPMRLVTNGINELLNISYLTQILLFIEALFLLLTFTFVVYLPVRRITKAAKEYASGNFEPKIDIHNNDEIGYLAATFNYMANELHTLEHDQRKFISNVSHDFRSPLTSIKGYIEAMLDGTIPPEMQEKYLNIILFETERLNHLTQSLLELNKYGSKGVMLDITEFDLNDTIKTTIQTFEGKCKEKHIRFDLILTGKELYVKADYGKIQRVLYNLIDNAIKFSHNDSSIVIETTERNEKVFISVKDTGIGIPKDSLNKVWERFYKTDLSRGKDKRGTGLGLSIVKEIIQAHEENIDVISTEGVGTEFIFTLPLSR